MIDSEGQYANTLETVSGVWIDQENVLRRQKLYLEVMTELLDQVVWRIDGGTLTLLDTSPSIKRLRGYEPDELIGLPLQDLLTPSSYRQILEKMPEWKERAASADSGEIQFFEVVEQPHRDGTTVWVEVAGSLFYRADGRVELVGVSRSLGQQQGLADVCRRLVDSERFLQVLWDAAPCMLSCVDANGYFLLINQRFADNRRIDRMTAPGRHFSEVLPNNPQIREQHERIFARCLTGQTVEFLDQYRPDDEDSDRWSYGKYKPVISADGKVKRVIAAIMDVTEQQEMKRQLTEAEKFGRTGSWYLHLSTGRFTCSDGLLSLYETDRKDFAVKGRQVFWSRLQPGDKEKLSQWEDREWLAAQKQLSVEVRLLLPDGTTRLVWVKGNVRTDVNGRPDEIYGIVTDVTERRALEEAGKQMLLRLREFSRTMPGAGMIVDTQGTVVEVFDGNGLLAADAETHWPGRRLDSLLPAKSAESLLKASCYAINQGRLQFGEYTLDLSRGRRHFDVRIAPISYLQEGQPTVACYLTDTTDQRRTKELLESTYEKRRQRELLNDLAEGELLPSQEVLDQAWQVNLNLTKDFVCYLLVVEPLSKQRTGTIEEQYEQQTEMADLLLLRLAGEQDVVAWESRDGIGILVSVEAGYLGDKEREITQAGRWEAIMRQCLPGSRYRIGIAEFHADTFWNFAKVYEQARLAVAAGKNLSSEQRVQHYLDIGVFQFFPPLKDSCYAKDFVQRTLNRLIEYDRVHGTELMNTLEAILHTDNLTAVSKQLYVHRQTILFRKQRIETVLGISLDNFETRLALGMALKFHQVYNEKM